MAKTSLKKPPAAAALEVVPKEAPGPASVAVPTSQFIEGDYDRSDFQTPRLQIVNAMSDLAEIHPRGGIVYNNDVLLSDGKTPVSLVVLHLKKSFIENIPYDDQNEDVKPRVLHTLEEVQKIGGTLTWIGEEEPSWKPVADLIVAVEATTPEQLADDITFGTVSGTRRFALAAWKIRGVSYAYAARTILTMARTVHGDIPSVQWNLSTRGEKMRGKTVYVPVLKSAGRVDADTRAALLAAI